MKIKYPLFIVSLLAALGLDQGSKIWARQVLKPKYPDVVTVIHGFFDLRFAENPGTAFSLLRDLSSARYLLAAIGVIALAFVVNMLVKLEPQKRWMPIALGLLAGGAIGNIVDRAIIGRVTDFIVWKVGAHEWPTFNIADAALVAGVIMVIIEGDPKKKKPA